MQRPWDEEELRDPSLVAGELVAAPQLSLGVCLVDVDVLVTPEEMILHNLTKYDVIIHILYSVLS